MRFQRAEPPLRIAGPAAARSFFAGCFAELDPTRESLLVAHLDDGGRCLHFSRHDGGAGGLPLPIRSLVTEIARRDSAAILIAHNHPSGDCRPSSSDLRATRRLALAAEALGCRLLDHFIFAGDRSTSLRSLGLL